MNYREQMNIVVVGHVDHGKSTVIGRLLSDTGSLPDGKLEQVKSMCERNARPFEYAFLLDALKDEQSQGITIDTARCFFKTEKRDYIIIDAPGHIEFLKNMVSGAARAEAAVLIIDAHEGIAENSRRHGYLMSMLGIQQIIVIVNKMDLIEYSRSIYEKLVREYGDFLHRLGIEPVAFVPVCARDGDNLAAGSKNMDWYKGPVLLGIIDSLKKKADTQDKPFRMPVQDIYKFTAQGDNRRIIAGTVESGTIATGDRIVFCPSGKKSAIKSIEGFNEPAVTMVKSGKSTGFTLEDELYIKRGEIMCRAEESQPLSGSRFRANVFWMSSLPLVKNRKYKLKIAASKTIVRLEKVISCIDATELTSIAGKQQAERHDVAECIFQTVKPIAFDPVTENEATGRFVIVDNYDIAGGGIILNAIDEQVHETDSAGRQISLSKRVLRNGHEGKAVIICGDERREETALALESQLFESGYNSYYSSIDKLRPGYASQFLENASYPEEMIIHIGETARILTDAGLIFITATDNIDADDIEVLRRLNEPYELLVVWSGSGIRPEKVDLVLETNMSKEQSLKVILEKLQSDKVIPDYSI